MIKRITLFISFFILIVLSINLYGQAPAITSQPSWQGVIEGQTATFNVVATGSGLTYQWYKDGSAISGALNSSYTTPATVLADSGAKFSVKVTNVSGSDSSNAATLFVTASGNRVTAGEVALYKFDEGSGTTINDVSGFNTPLNLKINKTSTVKWSPAGLLVKDTTSINSNIASKVIDTVTSNNEITIELWIRPMVTNEPSRILDLTWGNTETDFGVEANLKGYNFVIRTTNTNINGIPGTADTTGINTNLTHVVCTFAQGISKIYKDGTEVISKNIGGDFSTWNTDAIISLANIFGGNKAWKGIFYQAAIYNRALDSVEIVNNYSLGVAVEHAPFIIEQPKSVKAVVGYSATFNVSAVGDIPLSYQWQKNGTDISGASDSVYTTPPTSLTDSGSVYTVTVKNTSGQVTSDTAKLLVKGASPDCPNGIVHYYHLSESSSPYKDTVGFSDGMSSVPPASTSGIVGTAQNFSNQEKINIPSDNSFNWKSNESYSIEFWAKTSTTPADNEVIVGRRDGSSNFGWWIGLSTNGKAVFQLASGSTSATVGDKGSVINDGNWHLIVAVRNGNSDINYLYVDSSKIDSVTQSYATGFEGTSDITLGYYNINPFYYYNGALDEVAFYNVALPQSEIKLHFKKGLKGLGYCEEFPTINAPTNLKAIKDNIDTTNVKLSWDDNSSNELGFIIQRKLGDSASVATYTNIDTVGTDVIVYTDTTTQDTTKYTYRVYAYNTDTVSAFSNIATVTTPLPVELTSFSASVVNGKLMINWETATEINNAGFSIERSIDNNKFTEISFVKGKGTSTEKSFYSYIDKSALSGKYYYRLKQVDLDGTYQFSKSIEVDMGLPSSFSLEQNYPNPFNPSTTIRFALPINAKVNIKLYNTLGQEVKTILNNELNAGIHEILFNATNLSSGVYFYRLEAHGEDGSGFISTKRMLLMK